MHSLRLKLASLTLYGQKDTIHLIDLFTSYIKVEGKIGLLATHVVLVFRELHSLPKIKINPAFKMHGKKVLMPIKYDKNNPTFRIYSAEFDFYTHCNITGRPFPYNAVLTVQIGEQLLNIICRREVEFERLSSECKYLQCVTNVVSKVVEFCYMSQRLLTTKDLYFAETYNLK